MSDNTKTIEVLLKLNDQMTLQLNKSTDALVRANVASKNLERSQSAIQTRSNKTASAFSGMARSLGALAAGYLSLNVAVNAAQRGVGFIVETGKQYEQALANTKAILQPTTIDMLALARASKDLGASTRFTAAQAADAQTELGKLGFTTGQILGAQEASLNLAAAANLDLARAAEITAITIQQFNLQATDSGKVTDIIAKSAAMAALDVEQFGESMKYTGTIASISGYSIEETSAAIAALSDEAVVGSQAGTSLRRIISTLANESSLASKEIRKINPNAQTLADKFEALSKMGLNSTSAMKLFRIEASTAAVILANKSEKLRGYTERLKDAEGYAKRVAAVQMDTLAGDLLTAKSSVEDLAITLFQAFNAEQRGAVQSFTERIREVTKWFEENPDKIRAWSDTVKSAFNTASTAANGYIWLMKKFAQFTPIGVAIQGAGILSNLIGGTDKSSIEQYNMATEEAMRTLERITPQLETLKANSVDIDKNSGYSLIIKKRIKAFEDEISSIEKLRDEKYSLIVADKAFLTSLNSLTPAQQKELDLLNQYIATYTMVKGRGISATQALSELGRDKQTSLKLNAGKPTAGKGSSVVDSGIDADQLKDQERRFKDAQERAQKAYEDILDQRRLNIADADERYLEQRRVFWDRAIEQDKAGGSKYIDQLIEFRDQELALIASGIGPWIDKNAGQAYNRSGIQLKIKPSESEDFSLEPAFNASKPQTGESAAAEAAKKASENAIAAEVARREAAFALNNQYNVTELELEQIQYEERKALMEEFNLSTEAMKKEHDLKMLTMSKEIELAQLEGYANFVGGMAALMGEIAGKNRAMGKVAKGLAISQAAMDTYVAANRAMLLPPAPNFIAAGAATLYGLANVARISGLKFAKGGIVPGTSYTGDKVPAMMNSGERVLTAKQNRQYEAMMGGSTVTLHYAPVYTATVTEDQKRKDYRAFQRTLKATFSDESFITAQADFV